MNDSSRPVVLIICDGWGVGASDPAEIERWGNAVAMASTPVRDRLLAEYPWSLLTTSGEAVGLPAGQMGNSEVGHLNLGAGRIVHQDVTRISLAILKGSFFEIPELHDLGAALERSGGALHLIGLCSDGGVHSDISHLHALLDWAARAGIAARVHVFTDGRDASPTSGIGWIEELEAGMSAGRADGAARAAGPSPARWPGARIATVSGRYYAMDRDRRWLRTERAYRARSSRPRARVPRAPSPTSPSATPGGSPTSSCRRSSWRPPERAASNPATVSKPAPSASVPATASSSSTFAPTGPASSRLR